MAFASSKIKSRPYKYTGEYYRKVKNNLSQVKAVDRNKLRDFKNVLVSQHCSNSGISKSELLLLPSNKENVNPVHTTNFFSNSSEEQIIHQNTEQSSREGFSLEKRSLSHTQSASFTNNENHEISFEFADGERMNTDDSGDQNRMDDEDQNNMNDEDQRDLPKVIEDLKNWILKYRISHLATNELLFILNAHNVIGIKLPKDSRTLLSTLKNVNIIQMGSGEFWYNGLENNLRNIFSNIDKSFTVPIMFNVDGLPLMRSSKQEFWPILGAIYKMQDIKPFVVAIYNGDTKPDVQLYLRPLVNELKSLLVHGVKIGEYTISIKIQCFICDSPARCHIKGISYFNSYHGCSKCVVIGDFDRHERHMSFPRTNCMLRRNEDFRNKLDMDHHNEQTPLEELPIDMIADFPIADSLHLLDLGLMKRCLKGWIKGDLGKSTKWSGNDMKEINILLQDCNKRIPFEIHRSVRDLNCFHFWKGLEFRTFLLYLGPVVLKDFLPPDAYKHFILLFCAVRICSCDKYSNYLNIAKSLFNDYIEYFIQIYGEDKISSNIHNLCHVVEDVKRFGSLPLISTYQFENALFGIKRLIRSGNKPLAQTIKRLHELSKIQHIKDDENTVYPIVKQKKQQKHELISCEGVFHYIELEKNLILQPNDRNKWFLTKENKVVEMINATYCLNKFSIYGRQVIRQFDFFSEPVRSSFIDIYSAQRKAQMDLAKLYNLEEIKCKLMALMYRQEMVFFPILHTLDSKIK